jgi:hypothetical protein
VPEKLCSPLAKGRDAPFRLERSAVAWATFIAPQHPGLTHRSWHPDDAREHELAVVEVEGLGEADEGEYQRDKDQAADHQVTGRGAGVAEFPAVEERRGPGEDAKVARRSAGSSG